MLFTVGRAGAASFNDGDIVVASLATGERRVVVRHGSCAKYVPTGHLVYLRDGSMMAVAFDPERLETRGSAIAVVEHVMTQPTGAGHFAFSQNGCLVHVAGEAQGVKRRLVWIDKHGHDEPLDLAEDAIEEPRLSSDGTRVAFGVRGATSDIWIHHLADKTLARVTFDGDNFAPIWTPDGTRLTYGSNRSGPCHIFWQGRDDREAVELLGGPHDLAPGSWSPDGETLLFTEYNPATGADIWMSVPGSGAPRRALVRSSANAFSPACSPDGRSFAYTSDETGRFEVYLVPFPAFGAKTQISPQGGAEPVWSRDGRLYFRSGSSVMVADIDLATRQRIGEPRRVADGPYQPGVVAGLPNYDVASDGRLLMVTHAAVPAQADRLSVTIDWFGDLTSRVR